MGLLYDIWYPGGHDYDRDVGERYLDVLSQRVQRDRTLVGTVAVVKNGPAESITLCADGEWR